ncbi:MULTISPECIES: hypothetical protein [Stenotrophomonas]|uniref:hypothetical protein n=1 Tax=Stenotrophomonas TaxID=40323 RepID=UPI00201CCDC6|nr:MULTISPECIES: hypothetical protein [Stenotrophomonas]MBN5024000.1 hypothetical protein [Stenotrophomonas maltophilia]MDH1272783.1 hypothetical protein [Stenotrophomonas sp. GD03937]MDH1484582.1 hypothetical protein [Stenotrophomonas sp. GD03712]UQY94283.1 hypothetical protein LZ605_14165 [Stenotrophomonas maltophilia]WON69022.1 hypothetical protein RWT08_01315 [Stenotrophomonas maltophilia]
MISLATRCLALACLAAPTFAAAPPTAEQARSQLVEAVTCKRHLTPQQFDAMARLLAPAPARAQNGESSGEFRLTTPLMVLGQPVNRLQSYDGASGEDGIDSFTAYFSTARVEQIAALAKMTDPVAGTYTKEVGRHNLDVQAFDGQTTIACSYNLR